MRDLRRTDEMNVDGGAPLTAVKLKARALGAQALDHPAPPLEYRVFKRLEKPAT